MCIVSDQIKVENKKKKRKRNETVYYIGVVCSILYGVYSKGYKSFILFAIGTLVQFRSVASSLDKLDMDIRHFHSTVSNMFRDFI